MKTIKDINYFLQPTGNSCGPTCLKMIHSTIHGLTDNEISIDEICEMCETDWIVGTPPERMKKGMDSLGLNYIEYLTPDNPYQLLKEIIDSGNFPIIRTITQNMPHWIIPISYVDDLYNVYDPWLGRIQYTQEELDSIWSPRYYQFFEVKYINLQVGIPQEKILKIIEWGYPYFEHVITYYTYYMVIINRTNWDKSIMLLNGDRILGVYLFGDDQLHEPIFEGLIGVEGILLGVDKSIRGLGWGTKLKDYTKTLGADYVWGFQAKGLNNLDHWLKRRILISEVNNCYITAEIF